MNALDSQVILGRRWTRSTSPRSILAIREQCLGDLAVTLPYLRQIRDQHPSARFDLLSRVEYADFITSTRLFDDTYLVRGGNLERARLPHLLVVMLRLLPRRPDVILDLQNDRLSRLSCRVLRPEAWVRFDRYSPRPAAERVRNTLELVGLGEVHHETGVGDPSPGGGERALRAAGWHEGERLVYLNPAAFCPARRWPDEHWVELAILWLRHERVRFVLDGLPDLAPRATALQRDIGPQHVLNLVGTTGKGDLYGVLRNVDLVVSEDSGLMHIAWTYGVPTVALFGGGPSAWTRPVGEHTATFDGSGLDCAPCMADSCRFGDTRCLRRHSPAALLEKAKTLLRARTSPPWTR